MSLMPRPHRPDKRCFAPCPPGAYCECIGHKIPPICEHDWSRPIGFKTQKCSKCGSIEPYHLNDAEHEVMRKALLRSVTIVNAVAEVPLPARMGNSVEQPALSTDDHGHAIRPASAAAPRTEQLIHALKGRDRERDQWDHVDVEEIWKLARQLETELAEEHEMRIDREKEIVFMRDEFLSKAPLSENAPFTDPRIIREMRTALELIANGGLNEAKLVAIAAQALYNVRPPER